MPLSVEEVAQLEQSVSTRVATRGVPLDVTLRSIDEEKRQATFVAATENGVETWMGREYLRMAGLDLRRYQRNPVVLDTHNRHESAGVIGRAAVKRSGRELVATVTFAETERAEVVWELVRTDFVRALSVNFLVLDVLTLEEGQSDGRGAGKIEGPARIIRKSELYEISVVPVPADADTLRRELVTYQFTEMLGAAVSQLVTPTGGTETEQEYSMADKEKLPASETETKQSEQTPVKETVSEASPAELAQRSESEAVRAEHERRDLILAITPRGLEAQAETLILEGKTLEQARAALLEAQAVRSKPLGTPEPETPSKDQEQKSSSERTVMKTDDQTFVRALCG